MYGAEFFFHVLKPGRYLGGETGVPMGAKRPGDRTVIWFYPGRYEDAMGDPGWRRGFFQLANLPGIHCERAVEYAADVWQRLEEKSLPPFTLDGHTDLRQADTIVFWVPDLFHAARIPSIIRRLKIASGQPQIGVVIDGIWAPRFLMGHVDWASPAPSAWIPAAIHPVLIGDGAKPKEICDARCAENWDTYWSQPWSCDSYVPGDPNRTPRWAARVEIDDDFADVDLAAVNPSGVLHRRDPVAVVTDALDALRSTGIDGLRFCGSDGNHSQTIVTALTALAQRHNMKRVRAEWPEISADEFQNHWSAYRPHLLKPILRLRVDARSDAAQLEELGRQALNSGWHGLTAVLDFDSFASCALILPTVRQVLQSWSQAAGTFPDRRPLHLEYRPAPIDRWRDPPSAPTEAEAHRLISEFRHFKEDVSRSAAVGTFRIEDIIARNWIAAADIPLWDRLAELDLSDRNDPDAPPFDWFTWMRQKSGLTAPPTGDYSCKPVAASVCIDSPDASAEPGDILDLVPPGDDLFGRRRRKPAYTRRLAAPVCTRMRIRWTKELPWRLYSHLDLVRAIERAIRRSGLPAAYSEGFHPRLKLSFGPPLAFGVLSRSEHLDLLLEEDYEPPMADRLAAVLPDGITLAEARGMPAGIPALTDTINEAIYRAVVPLQCDRAQQMLAELRARPTVEWSRADRPDRRPFDPRPSLRDSAVETTAEGTVWNLTVQVGGEGTIRPTDWATLAFGFSADEMAGLIIVRTALLIRRGGRLCTPFEPL